MEKLPKSKFAAILRCLIEGSSMMSTSRITGCSKNTVQRVVERAGAACQSYLDKHLINLPCKNLQIDENWSFVGCKERSKGKTKREHTGDVWTWLAICADTKLIPSYRVGDRSTVSANAFCADMAQRMAGQVQITSDGLGAYEKAIQKAFGKHADYARYTKQYGKSDRGIMVVTGVNRESVLGKPDMKKANTSYIERANLSIRMTNRRFTRKTNAFSKKLENHSFMLALTIMWLNFGHRHSALEKRQTPAMAAGLADHVWTLNEIVEMTQAYEEEMLNAEFEAAFAKLERKTKPKCHLPQPKKTPWYLDKDSGGPNPPVEERKEDIAYEDEPEPIAVAVCTRRPAQRFYRLRRYKQSRHTPKNRRS